MEVRANSSSLHSNLFWERIWVWKKLKIFGSSKRKKHQCLVQKDFWIIVQCSGTTPTDDTFNSKTTVGAAVACHCTCFAADYKAHNTLTSSIPSQFSNSIILKYLLYAVDTIYYSYSAIEMTCYCTLVLFLKKNNNNNSKTTTGSCYIVLQLQLYDKFRLCSIQLIFRRYQC